MQVLGWLFVGLFVATFASSDKTFNTESCGKNGYEASIRRPSISRLREYPWLARLGYRRNNVTEFHFHGTLIHPYYVVTTVAAAEYFSNSLETVRLGDYDTSISEDCQEIADKDECAPPPQDIRIEQIIKHPNHNRPRTANDLVLIKLHHPASYTEFVRPVCLPTRDFIALETVPLFLPAWCGSEKSGISVVPFQYRMEKIGSSLCTEKLSQYVHIELHEESQFCATLDLDGKKPTKEISLRGSIGAPLQLQDNSGQFYLVGMSSIGVKRAPLGTPYVFTNVMQLSDWLRETVQREEQRRAARV